MINIRRYPLPESSFMCGWVMPENVIDDLMEKFKEGIKNDIGHAGGSGGYVDTDKKDSYDIGLSANNFEKPFGEYRECLQVCLEDYLKIYKWCDESRAFDIKEPINLQYYKPGGGFKQWHSENNFGPKVAHRNLVFMTFLNDVPNGGTDFYYQRFTVPAIKGLTVIWPSTWTHTHKGEISETHEKYIITGWYNAIEAFDVLGHSSFEKTKPTKMFEKNE